MDLSETAVARALKLAKRDNFELKAVVQDIGSMEMKPESYTLVIISNVLNFFHEQDIQKLVEKVKKSLQKGGFIYINAFDEREQRTGEKNRNFHYFTKKELLSYFVDYQTISLSQTYALDLSHGRPHYHHTIELLTQKTH